MPKEKYKIIRSINDYKISKFDKFFFDANVWIYILNDEGNKENKKYTEFLQKILENNGTIVTNQEVMSEVISRILKKDARLHGFIEKKDYKEYRKSAYYRECFKTITAIFLQILEKEKLIFEPINLTKENFKEFLVLNVKEQQRNILDYKDYIYTIFAKDKDYIIVTHDKDFASLRVGNTILTANTQIIGQKFY